MKTNRVFLDYASTTPVDNKVVKIMQLYLNKFFHNASALYSEGVANRQTIDDCRKKISRIVQSRQNEVIFTGSGTESINLAIIGTVREIAEKIKKEKKDFVPHVITTNIEHVAVLESVKRIEKEGASVTYLPVAENGQISEKDIINALRPETVLISVMLANNEIGTILPIRKIGIAISKYKKENNRSRNSFPYFHTDASQGPNYLEINIDQLSVDMMTLDGSKIYGPKGVGCLIKKSFVPLQPVLYGGSHEFGFRPSTENLPQIVGFTKALEIADENREKEFVRLSKLQNYFFEKIVSQIPNTKINGDTKNRLPNNISICIDGLNSEFAVIQMDDQGVCCAAMSACKNLSGEANSYVVEAISTNCGRSSLRFSMGRFTKKSDIDFAIKALKKITKINI